MKSATAQLEEIARDRVACGQARTLEEGITQAVEANPELYRESMTEGDKVLNQLPCEIEAALAILDAGERAEIDKLATKLYLEASDRTQADSYMMALQQTPRVHLKCASAQPVVKAAGGKVIQASDFEGKAQALVTAGQAKTIDEAFEIVAASDPTAYGEYLKSLA